VNNSGTAQKRHLEGVGGIFSLNFLEKGYYISVLSDTAVDV